MLMREQRLQPCALRMSPAPVQANRSDPAGRLVASHDWWQPLAAPISGVTRMNVREGDVVSRTTVLGEVGSTGRSTGPHLHMEIWCRDYRIDPVAYLVKAFDVYHRLMSSPRLAAR
jgi:murein DD-endopeptidase MepM/ murein hydrolase activator NlpD